MASRIFGLNVSRLIYSGIRAAGGLLTGIITRQEYVDGVHTATETYTCQGTLKSSTELDEQGNNRWLHEVSILAESVVGVSRINLQGGAELGPGFSSGFSRGFRFGGRRAVITEPTSPIPAIDDEVVFTGFAETVKLVSLEHRGSSAASYRFIGR